jgi:hypothetical protein
MPRKRKLKGALGGVKLERRICCEKKKMEGFY